MIKADIAKRYSKVLFNLDLENDYLTKRLNDLDALVELFNINPELTEFLNSPQITHKQKVEFLKQNLKSLDSDLVDFVIFLIKKKRLEYLESIANKYRNLVNEHFGIWEAEMVVSAPVKKELIHQMIEKLERSFHKKIKVQPKIKPEIIGGAILLIENTMIDWSITGRLKKMKERLLET